jgi:signal transduction histidine kinase/PAS domain-containing protein
MKTESPLALVSYGPESSITTDSLAGPNIATSVQTQMRFGYRHEDLADEPFEMLMAERFRNYHAAHESTAGARPTGTLLEFPIQISPASSLKTDEGNTVSAIEDVSDLERTQELHSDVEFERVVSRLVETFTDLAIDCIDGEITNGLKAIAEVLDLDGAAILLTDLNAKNGTISHWWGREGVPPPPAGNIDELDPWLSRRIINREIVCASAPKDLPEEAVAERNYIRSAGLKSWLEIPLEVGAEQHGRMSTSTFHRFQTWDSRLVSRFQQAGDVFASAVARKRAAEALGGSEERFRILADSVPIKLWMSGRDKLCSFVNQIWLAFTGQVIQKEQRRIWPIVGASFTVLLLLLPLFGWLVLRQTERTQARTKELQRSYQLVDVAITDIRSSLYKVDEMIGASSRPLDINSVGLQIMDIHRRIDHNSETLSALLDPKDRDQLVALRGSLDLYWETVDRRLRGLSSAEVSSPGRDQGLPNEVLRIAERIDALNEKNLWRDIQEIEGEQSSVREFATKSAFLLFALEFAIACMSTAYLFRFETISTRVKTRADKAESELRRLSNQLILVQEEERRTISRELHDEVGQVLTGLRMELGTLTYGSPDEVFHVRLQSLKQLAEQALHSVRDLALLLRPSMLDDLGLEPALRWQAKEFSHRTGVPVAVTIQSRLDRFPEPICICLYRIIQEALTNCAKHAKAHRVALTIKVEEGVVFASVQDDGIGLDAKHLQQTQGLGLLGMGERVRALQGHVAVTSRPGTGTLVKLSLPVA